MFNICLIGENVVESKVVIEYRLTKWLKKFIEKGGRRFFIGGDKSFTPLALGACSQERKKDLTLRYFCNPCYDSSVRPLQKYKEMIDNSEVIICYYNPDKGFEYENLFFNFARIKKKRIVNLFQGESHYWFGEPVDELENTLKKWIEMLKHE